MRLLGAALLWATLQPPAAPMGWGGLQGWVRQEGTYDPLPGARLEIVHAGAIAQRAYADRRGFYRLSSVPAGWQTVRAWHPGYDTLELQVWVPAGAEVTVEFALAPRPVPLAPLDVAARPSGLDADSASGPRLTGLGNAVGRVGQKALEEGPGVDGVAPTGTATTPSQVGAEPAQPGDMLLVRSSSADLKLVLLDGAPVYAPFHLGGLLDPLDPALLRSAVLYLGGAPARYGGALSYVVELATRPGRGDRLRFGGAVDPLTGRAVVEDAFGPVHWLVGTRAVHAVGAPLLGAGGFPYRYSEAVVRADVPRGPALLSATGFLNREVVRLDPEDGLAALWDNAAASVRYRTWVGNADAEFTLAAGRFGAALPRRADVAARGRTARLRAAADFARPLGPTIVRYGAIVERLELVQEVASRQGEPLVRRATTDAAGVYGEVAWSPVPFVRLRGGLRGDIFLSDVVSHVAPRLAVTVRLADHASLTLAAGRYYQYVRAGDFVHGADAPLPDPDSTPDARLAVGRASHWTVALVQDVQPVGLQVGVEGYYKAFGGVPTLGSDRAYASGMDLWVRSTGPVQGWIGYSLGWLWADTVRFQGRQLLSAGARSSLGDWADVGVRFAYGAGLPFSALPLPNRDDAQAAAGIAPLFARAADSDDPASPPPRSAEPYVRLDLEVSRTFLVPAADGPMALTPYLRVLNAIGHRDALFYRYRRGRAPEGLATLPLLPLLGLEWRF